MIPIIRTSTMSGITRTRYLDVTTEQLIRYHDGELAQDVFTNLNAEDKEFIISGVTLEEWEELFANNADTDV